MQPSIRVLIAEDTVIAREGMRRVLEREQDIALVGVVTSAPEVLPAALLERPDVLLLDLKWHGDNNAMEGTVRSISQECPEICIVGLTAYPDLMPSAKAAERAGYCRKKSARTNCWEL